MFRLATVGLALAMVGCASIPPSPDITPVPIEVITYAAYECSTPPDVDRMELLDVEFRILAVGETQLFTLTPDMHENLGKNTSAILAGARQLSAQRDYYVACIEASQNLTNDSE